MSPKSYAALVEAIAEFRSLVDGWTLSHPYLPGLLEHLRVELGYEDYRVETPIVFNRALDDLSPGSDIRVILVADNPGKNEQKAVNNRYLVGQSGKLAAGWFADKLGIDFRKEVLILNKTPVHTPKTAELRKLLAAAGSDRQRLEGLLAESQLAMAGLAARLHLALGAVLWISGCGELRKGGLFQTYRDELSRLMSAMTPDERGRVWAFNHFSMNQFAIEVKRKSDPCFSPAENLALIGAANRERIFGL
jgi:hypothetical protein